MNSSHPMPRPLKRPLTRNVILGLLLGAFALVGYIRLPAADGPESVQRAPQAAVAGVPATDAARFQLAGESQFLSYTAWLAAAHAHAAVHGQNAPLPSQF